MFIWLYIADAQMHSREMTSTLFFFNFSQVKFKNSEENGSKTTTNMRIPGSVDFLNLCVSKEKISKFSSIAKKKKEKLGNIYIVMV